GRRSAQPDGLAVGFRERGDRCTAHERVAAPLVLRRGFQEETAGTPLRQAAVQAQRRLRVREHGRVDGDDPAVATAAGELVLRRGEPHASSRPVKHVAVPVWHAAPVWSTTYSSVSPSQSVATERTCCACPEVSPLTQISPRDR